jgi:Flp pilus assembly protein TadD
MFAPPAMNARSAARANRKHGISREAAMKASVLLALFLAATLVAAHPRILLANKIDKQYRQAVEMFRQGDLKSAAREFEEILRAKPKHEKARILLGLTHSQLGQEIEVAFRLFQKRSSAR